MSRLTAPFPSHLRSSSTPLRPSQHPPSPPETDKEYMPPRKQPLQSLATALPDRPASPGFSETAGRSIRRSSSTLPYTQTGIKDRRRSIKTTRWLVIVIPRPSFTAPGPSSPPSQPEEGILMPLYSTFFNQLSAVARDFSLPSTVGIRLYLQLENASLKRSPRLSDDAWQILWSTYLSPLEEASAPLPAHGFPIAGHLEFDIDLLKAKWYHGWVSGSLNRISYDSSIDSSLLDSDKVKEDAKTAVEVPHVDDTTSEAGTNGFGRGTRTGRGTAARSVASTSTAHGPRQLSLLNRRDHTNLASINAPPRPVHYALETGSASSRFTHDDELRKPTASKLFPNGLSPIPQQDTPTSARDLNTAVQKWRHSSASIPTAVLATSPAEPNTPPSATATRDTTGGDPIDLADFSWSVSSHGPSSPSPSEGPASPTYARSMHMAERASGSVLLTPSTNTTWGPTSDVGSPISDISRYPSPDIAARMIEDSPYTPTTATSWGASSWSAGSARSETSAARLSPDIAARMIEDSPPTPSTATTWGAPLSYPPTPAFYNVDGDFYRLPSPDVGQRSFEEGRSAPGPSRMGWPCFQAGELGRPSGMGWPYFVAQAPQPAEASGSQTRFGWPHVRASLSDRSTAPASVSRMGWPYNTTPRPTTQPAPVSRMGWPYTSPPQITVQPAPVSRMGWPYKPSSAVQHETLKSLSVQLPRLPSAVYPHFDLYPASSSYPHFDIYPAAVIPTSSAPENSPAAHDKSLLPINLPRGATFYPHFDLYPATYPTLEIYPPTQKMGATKKGPLVVAAALPRLQAGYPDFNLYPVGYPMLDIYPERKTMMRKVVVEEKALSVKLPRTTSAAYPDFDLYPAGYPTMEIYPPTKPVAVVKKAVPMSVTLPRPSGAYPDFKLYPAVYPTLEIYPEVASAAPRRLALPKSLPVMLPMPAVVYPKFNLYPAAYPTLDIYPELSSAAPRPLALPKGLPVALPMPASVYPEFNLYPAAYPTFNIYPAVARPAAAVKPVALSTRLPRYIGYPNFDLYGVGYPVLEIYPAVSVASRTAEVRPVPQLASRFVSSQYPVLDIYPAVYPFITPYPAALNVPSKPAEQVKAQVAFRPYVPKKTHQMLHDEWMVKQVVRRPSLPRPQLPRPDIPLPPVPATPVVNVPVRSRARSGTVSRRPTTPPKPSVESNAEEAAALRSRNELHNLIFGGGGELPARERTMESPLSSTASSSTASPMAFTESPQRDAALIGKGTPLETRMAGLPTNPRAMLGQRRASATGLSRSNSSPRQSPTVASTVSRMTLNLGVVAEAPTEEPASAKSLRRSGSMGRMRTNDDLFKQRQSLYNPRKLSGGSIISEFPSPPVSPGRPVSKLDMSQYSFLR